MLWSAQIVHVTYVWDSQMKRTYTIHNMSGVRMCTCALWCVFDLSSAIYKPEKRMALTQIYRLKSDADGDGAIFHWAHTTEFILIVFMVCLHVIQLVYNLLFTP